MSLTVPVAPEKAQQELVALAERIDQEHDTARSVLAASITLLTEYKQALITAAVTGELDVTTASTKQPA